MNNYEEFMNRSEDQIYLAIMDKIGVKLEFTRPDESPLWEDAKIRRYFADEINKRLTND